METQRLRTQYMECLTNASYEEVQLAVADMTQEKAQEVHKLIEPNWKTVCYLSGRGGIGRSKYTSLLRKMGLIATKAKGAST